MVVTDSPPTFDGHAPGTPESVWDAVGFVARAAPLELDRYRRLIVVSAHPDDETLGAAGLIARLHGRGIPIELIVASDGERSHPHRRTTGAAALGHRRRKELVAATAHLAPRSTIRWLGRPDGKLAAHCGDLVDAIGRVLGTTASNTLVAAPWRADGHPDHEAVAQAAEQAAEGSGAAVIEFPIWAWLWAASDDPRLHPEGARVLHLAEPERHRKLRAIAEHRSQIAPLGDDPGDQPVLTPGFLEHFRRRYETFLPVGEGCA